MTTAFAPIPRLRGRVDYRRRADAELWGFEDWSITRLPDGTRTMAAHCEMRLGADWVVRDSTLSAHADWRPADAFVRIARDGRTTGTGWFRFTDGEAECESWSIDAGRLSQRMPVEHTLRGFGVHAVQADGWLAARFPYDRGAGHEHFFGRNLIHSLHHLGATGPYLHTTESGLRYLGPETVTVPAGTFDCHRIAFVGMTNGHPPYDMWITRDGAFLYVKGEVGGYMDSVFELTALDDG